ncbi:hypothetical protein RU86_GL001648 [Lactococcus piscium]|uniref:Uncharacterized protein n=1 Tax=Pseudolactococcus piscium TaxID=1364 RepID=A0A2A5RUH5_9LACT|nr:bifunctional DNA primase/polymerase [Lactococcus piscium]PCS04301.1 hypothetical protein RU86_GL001648 [Lactococcus piscium]
MTPKEQALFCISQGIHVIAGYPAGKSERAILKGTVEGTLSSDLACSWFDEIPNRNILINLKNSGLICIDLDQHKDGQNGVKAFNALWQTHNKDKPLNTYVEKTPTGAGVHIFFKVPIETFSKPIVSELMDGVEIKTHFTPIYPSKRTDGDYQPFNSDDTLASIADCPSWLLDMIHKPPKRQVASKLGKRTYSAEMWELFNSGASEGRRNIDTNKVLHYWRKIGIEPSACMDLLQAFNTKTSPPLDDKELTAIWESVFKMV